MDTPPVVQRLQSHITDESSNQDEVAQPQLSGHRESNTFDGIGIQSRGSFNVGGNLFINVGPSYSAKEQNEEKEKKEVEAKRNRLVELLKFPESESRKFAIKKAHASTCEWILVNQYYERWARKRQEKSPNNPPDLPQDRSRDKFIWLKGKPGTGKSTMMKFLLGDIQNGLDAQRGLRGAFTSSALLISFFFNARGTELEKSTPGLYRSLLIQLFKSQPDVRKVLDTLIEPHDWTVNSLEIIFENAVLELKGLPVICLIDALDECGESQIRDMVKFLNRLTQVHDKLHICFASRHYPHISITSGLEVVLEHQSEHHNDIKRYMSAMLQIGYGQLADQIRSDILAKASGIFMWVVLVVDILNRESDAGRKHSLRKRLEELPKDLHELFRDILSRDDNEHGDGLLLCLQWLLFSKRPLKPRELYFAIISGLEPENLFDCHDQDISDDDIRKYILNNSRGLAESIGYRVQFIHESVVDFLIKDNGLATIFSDFGNGVYGKSHDLIKSCCLKYIEFVDSCKSQHQSKAAPNPSATIQEFPFEDYARAKYIFHAEKAEAGGIDQTDFISNFRLGNWRRPNSHTPSFLYVLAKESAASLIQAHPTSQSCFNIEEARYTMPIMAAVFTGSKETVAALLEMEVRRLPVLSFQDLCNQVPLPGVEGMIQARHEYYFQEDIDTLVQLARFAPELATIVFLRTTWKPVNVADSSGRTPMFYAISRHHYVLLEYLIDVGADLSSCDHRGRLPTHWAVQFDAVEAIDILARNRCNVNACDTDGKTPLHHAIGRDIKMVNCLIRCQGDVNANDKAGRTPLHYIAQRYFLHGTYDLLSPGGVLDLLLQGGAHLDAGDEEGMTALHYAAFLTPSAKMVSALVRNRALVDARDKTGLTPLHYAAYWATVPDIVGVLVHNGADGNAPNKEGQTPLHYAAYSRRSFDAVITILVQNGAQLSARDQNGRTPLHWAMRMDDLMPAEKLLSIGAEASATDKDDETPLKYALRSHDRNRYPLCQAICMFQRYGVDVSAVDGRQETLLHWCVGLNLCGTVEALVDHGAEVDKPDKNGYTPIWWAVYASSPDAKLIRFLIQRGADILSPDQDGYTLLHRAVEQSKFDVVKVLEEEWASPGSRNNHGQSPLDEALEPWI